MKRQENEVRGLLYIGIGRSQDPVGTAFVVAEGSTSPEELESSGEDEGLIVEPANSVGYHDVTMDVYHEHRGLPEHRVISGIFVPQNPSSRQVDLKAVAEDLRRRFGPGSMLVKPLTVNQQVQWPPLGVLGDFHRLSEIMSLRWR